MCLPSFNQVGRKVFRVPQGFLRRRLNQLEPENSNNSKDSCLPKHSPGKQREERMLWAHLPPLVQAPSKLTMLR